MTKNYLQTRTIKDVLLIGGGGFQFPKYFLSHQTGNIDVVEINSILYGISKKYFFLKEVFNNMIINKQDFIVILKMEDTILIEI